MPTEEKHVETTVETVVADTAALAANSAERAQAAAADAIANAQVAAAGVAQQAAEEIRSTQQGLSEWQSSIQRQHELLASKVDAQGQATEARLRETTEALSSILSKLEPKLESPPNLNPASSEKLEPRSETVTPAEPAPAKRKAHRWI
jgi:hypothetical protein